MRCSRPEMLSRACVFVFCLTLSWLMFVRPPARARAAGLLPGIVAFVATYSPWVLAFLPLLASCRRRLPSSRRRSASPAACCSSIRCSFSAARSASCRRRAGWSPAGPMRSFAIRSISRRRSPSPGCSCNSLPFRCRRFVIHVGVAGVAHLLRGSGAAASFPEYAGYAQRTSPASSRTLVLVGACGGDPSPVKPPTARTKHRMPLTGV